MDKVRRKEFKKARWYKRRRNRRHPISRIFKRLYEGIQESLIPLATPLLGMLKKQRRRPKDAPLAWDGQTLYFDVVTVPRDKGATEAGG